MARPTRTFTGQEGQRATGSAGPDPIRRDFDAIFAMFNPEATLPTGEAGGIDASENMKPVQLDPNLQPTADVGKIPTILSWIANRIKAIVGGPDWKTNPPTTLAGLHSAINAITVNQNQAPEADTGNLQQMLSWIVNRIRAITGKSDWKDDPGVTLQDISNAASHEDISFHAIAKSGVHGVGNAFVAKTSRSDQWPSWNDIPDKPASFPPAGHSHNAGDITSGVFNPARIPDLPASKVTTGVFDVARIPDLPASKVNSGVFDQARLPRATTQQSGIVQLTNSRSSASETMAVTAKALNDHRTSADHDGRYYTKAEVNQLISQGAGVKASGQTSLGTTEGTRTRLVPFTSVAFDTHGMFSQGSTRLTIKVTGIYIVHVRGTFQGENTGSRTARLRKNGAIIASLSQDPYFEFSVIERLNVNDYLEVEGENFNITSASFNVTASAVLL